MEFLMDSGHVRSDCGSEPDARAGDALFPIRIADSPALLIRPRQPNEELRKRGRAEIRDNNLHRNPGFIYEQFVVCQNTLTQIFAQLAFLAEAVLAWGLAIARGFRYRVLARTPDQKLNLPPSCNTRPGSEPVICPKDAAPTLFTVGLFQFARLKALNASAWNCTLRPSLKGRGKILRSDRSHW